MRGRRGHLTETLLRRPWVWIAAVTLCWMVTPVAPASAATAESDLVWILEDEVVPEDLYAVGNNVRVSGRVEGDLVAVAGEELRVEGVVTGSVTVFAARVVIAGVVEGSVRGAAGEMVISGRVGGDVVAAAAVLRATGEVERDILAAVWSAATRGRVGRDLRGLFRTISLGGEIAGDAEIRTRGLTGGADLSILGDLDYRADRIEGETLEDKVEGSMINRRALPPNIRVRAFGLMVYVSLSLLMLAGGLVIIRVASSRVREAADRATKLPLRALGKGLALFLSPLVGLALLGMAVAWLPLPIWGPMAVGAVPLLVILAGVWLTASLVSHIPVAVAAGRAVGRRLGRHWELSTAYLVGAVAYFLALRIPLVGLPLVLAATVLGAGGWLGRRGPAGADEPRAIQPDTFRPRGTP